ncbi:hypothetical protein SIID45300_01041 [Candidatus Magnetaquicoccaceae bacterium FCR-1]|uniref:Uncharacterized protein n=1 Tax=Candidatus Magnetaquiglobus chichijimensis TaxID=3141448 RepID=A0ABQ0C770_9PROT
MRESKSKTLHYRKAVLTQRGYTLQSLLERLLNEYRYVEDRWQDMDEEGKSKRLINHHLSEIGMEFGNFLSFESGANRLLMTVMNSVTAMDVGQIAPTSSDEGLRREFLDAILYYGIRGNHVILLQSSSLQARQFEDYLNWWLHRANIKELVRLLDEPDPDIARILNEKNVKSLRLRSDMLSESVDMEHRKSDKEQFSVQGRGSRIIASVLGVERLATLDLERVGADDLVVDVVVTYNRSTSSTGQNLLDKLSRMVSRMDAEGTQLIVPGVGTISGNQLRQSKRISVETRNGEIVQNDLFPKMQRWLEELVAGETIHG